MIRFFVDPSQIQQGRVILGADDAHHLRAVLKATAGYRMAVLDGAGTEYLAELLTLTKSEAVARVLSERRLNTEARTHVTVAQALPKMADRLEQVLQRGTEVGVAAFHCFQSERSVPHLEGDRHAKRLMRAMAIVKTAAEQAHRARVPEVVIDASFADILNDAQRFDLALVAYEGEAAVPLRSVLEGAQERLRAKVQPSILVVVGPEGGFSDDEASAAGSAGVALAGLGPRILRTETAALVAVSQILYVLEPTG